MAQGKTVQRGDHMDYTPAAAVVVGQVVVVGRILGIASRAIAADALGALAIEGVFDIVSKNEAITAGAAVYWDADGDPYGGTAGTGAITATISDVLAGYATAAAGATDGTVRVKLDRAPLDLPT